MFFIIFPFFRVSSAFDTLGWCFTNQGRLPCSSEGLVASTFDLLLQTGTGVLSYSCVDSVIYHSHSTIYVTPHKYWNYLRTSTKESRSVRYRKRHMSPGALLFEQRQSISTSERSISQSQAGIHTWDVRHAKYQLRDITI